MTTKITIKKPKPTPFWTKEINAAARRKKQGHVAFADEIIWKAENWQDCVCGNQDPRIPRNSNGEPTDSKLLNLGVQFADDVEGQDPAAARKTMKAIEKRSGEILYVTALIAARDAAMGKIRTKFAAEIAKFDVDEKFAD